MHSFEKNQERKNMSHTHTVKPQHTVLHVPRSASAHCVSKIGSYKHKQSVVSANQFTSTQYDVQAYCRRLE